MKIILHFWANTDLENQPETYKVPVGIFQLANEHLLLKLSMYLPYVEE